MKDPQKQKFMQVKQQVIDNLEKLRLAVNPYTEEGMPDESAAVYNEIVDLLDEASATELIEELPAIVINAENVEKRLDMWLSDQGIDTMELEWPSF